METRIRNPHQRAIVTIGLLTIFSFLSTLVIWGLSSTRFANFAMTWICLIFFIFFGSVWVIIWLLGLNQIRKIKEFLESDRPLVSWTYSEAEWKQYKEIVWKGETGDWKIQFGCLTFLLALAGMLTGMLIGLDGGLLEAVRITLIGLLSGGLFGAMLGILVAGGNLWGARQAYRQKEPGQVALGPNEIYANYDYFRGNDRNSFIRDAKINRGNPGTLEVELVVPPRPRASTEQQWSIMIPSQWVERVEEILPVLKAPG